MRINKEIRAKKVLLIDSLNNNHGVVDIDFALKLALEQGMDLVEVSPNVIPPVCRIDDFGKIQYKANKTKKNQKVLETKDVKIRLVIDEHDYNTKINQCRKWLEKGINVKFAVKFVGREIMYTDVGFKKMAQVKEDLAEFGDIEKPEKLEGKEISITFKQKKS